MGKGRIICPVCGKYTFVGLTKTIMEGKEELDDFCVCCGWVFDINQLNDHDACTKINEMSINDRKKWYENKIKEDSNFEYLDSLSTEPEPHMCLVCGKYKFKDTLSYEICKYCGWEDDGYDDEEVRDEDGGANQISFNKFKRRYNEIILKNPNYIWEDEQDK